MSQQGAEFLEAILARLTSLPPEELQSLARRASEDKRPWIPTVGPQRDAYHSPADILLYGGQAGGGKTALVLGLAFTAHRRSLILRRRYVDLNAIIEDALAINGSRDGFNGSAPPRLRTADGRLIEFGAANHPGDEDSWRGQPHDLLAIDEATQFTDQQVRFLMGWVRTTDPDQRTRTVMATNPPSSATGEWVIGMFRPWLDITHPNPAKGGELRWFVTAPDGSDLEVPGPEPIELEGRMLRPMSRSFIPARLGDNPYLVRTDYGAKLDALPEPLRSAVRDGNFMAARPDADHQVIPSDWLRAAQARWTPRPPDGLAMTAIGVDVAAGGKDSTVLAARYDFWFAPLIVVPGRNTPTPSSVAALVVQHRRHSALVIVDVGGGYGGGVVEHLKGNDASVTAFNGSNAAMGRTLDRSLGFVNKRSEAWWRLREALDLSQAFDSPIAIPDDPILFADLTAPTFGVGPRGIAVEGKDDIKTRIGRSPDRGDAVVMAWADGLSAMRSSIMRQGQAHRYRDLPTMSENPYRSPRAASRHGQGGGSRPPDEQGRW
jgi:hypothetical protein